MARIEGVPMRQAGPMVKLVYRLGPRMMKKLTGREPQTGSGLEPIEIWAHRPKMMMGMGKFNQAVHKGKSVEERLKNLVELKGAQMIGCEFCVDLGSQICRNSGCSDEELLALPRYRQSDLFTDREKLALDYTVAVMHTPVEVTDELFDQMRDHFNDEQLVEITARLTGSARPGSAAAWCVWHRTAPHQPRAEQDRLGRAWRSNGLSSRPAGRSVQT
jgi:alkylhydroperoxidase family enzyme